MARVRQARRCKARRTDGRPCGAYAIVGGVVCRAHGGAAPQVKRAARRRADEDMVIRAALVGVARWQAEVAEWRERRIIATATVLDMRPEDVTTGDILAATWMPGGPESWDTKPRPRVDHRYGPRRR